MEGPGPHQNGSMGHEVIPKFEVPVPLPLPPQPPLPTRLRCSTGVPGPGRPREVRHPTPLCVVSVYTPENNKPQGDIPCALEGWGSDHGDRGGIGHVFRDFSGEILVIIFFPRFLPSGWRVSDPSRTSRRPGPFLSPPQPKPRPSVSARVGAPEGLGPPPRCADLTSDTARSPISNIRRPFRSGHHDSPTGDFTPLPCVVLRPLWAPTGLRPCSLSTEGPNRYPPRVPQVGLGYRPCPSPVCQDGPRLLATTDPPLPCPPAPTERRGSFRERRPHRTTPHHPPLRTVCSSLPSCRSPWLRDGVRLYQSTLVTPSCPSSRPRRLYRGTEEGVGLGSRSGVEVQSPRWSPWSTSPMKEWRRWGPFGLTTRVSPEVPGPGGEDEERVLGLWGWGRKVLSPPGPKSQPRLRVRVKVLSCPL